MTDNKIACRVMVSEPPHYIHSHRCNFMAKTDDGLCGVHQRKLGKNNETNRKYGWREVTADEFYHSKGKTR